MFRSAAFLSLIILAAATQLSLHSEVVPHVKGHYTSHARQTVWLTPPQLNAEETSCVNGDCIAVLHFSDPTIPPIAVKSCIGGTPANLGDLDNDGLDEIGLLPEWFTSCWRNYYVYTFKHGHWQYAVPPISTHCNQWEANIKPITKDPTRKGFVKINYSAFQHDSIVVKTKSVPIK
ncbi:hypothetical protein [Mucilaginibacter sp. UYCu711]|uniref:hypothetical protein n=1 Tax=Mucilaginibacter sp. UYCu711 TaxID=3156339 RepID=UPI003D205574